MPEVKSAGLMMYAFKNNELFVFLVHPGGPYFKNKDEGFWSIPKGLPEDEDESMLESAKREFEEETGIKPEGEFIDLGNVKQKSGKVVFCYAFETDEVRKIEVVCNLFDLEWPPKSGKFIRIPEIDGGKFFDRETSREKINSAQIKFIERLEDKLNLSK